MYANDKHVGKYKQHELNKVTVVAMPLKVVKTGRAQLLPHHGRRERVTKKISG